MNAVRQGWLVALREMRERSRTRAFRASVVIMIVVVLGVILVPAMLQSDASAKKVGLAGTTSSELPDAIQSQSVAVGPIATIQRFQRVEDGEAAVRDSEIDVLVVDGMRLEWRNRPDAQLQAVVTGAIQIVAVRQRATEVGISADTLLAVVEPVRVENVELGSVAGRSPDDETAALLMTVVLFIAISTYGSLVLTGVVEEKASRVVEVLLARVPARTLLAGKVTGIGLLGIGQVAVTALVALVALSRVETFDVPAVRASVIVWAVVWFVIGYALYAMVFGALGSLASRSEDAQSVAGPVTAVLIAAYFASFAAVGSPDSVWARLVSLFPVTAPLAMPNRIAMGTAEWWEPLVAVAATLAAIAGLVQFGGRVYAGAILHTGPTLKLRDAMRGSPAAAPRVSEDPHGSR